jgi:hypothetical protein
MKYNHPLSAVLQATSVICISLWCTNKKYACIGPVQLLLDLSYSLPPFCNICGTEDKWQPGSVVSIATRYGLDGPGIESRWRRDFPHLSTPPRRLTQPPIQ